MREAVGKYVNTFAEVARQKRKMVFCSVMAEEDMKEPIIVEFIGGGWDCFYAAIE